MTGEPRRLAANPQLALSLRHRFPYIDPLNHLQVELLRRIRRQGARRSPSAQVRLGVHISINGVAAGLRNSG
jgi:phosphoenolpyruvate carboxylase